MRPYYGFNVNGDMGGDLGIVDYSTQIVPDMTIISAFSYAIKNGRKIDIRDFNAEKVLPEQEVANIKDRNYKKCYIKMTAPTSKLDIQFCRYLKKNCPELKIFIFGHAGNILKEWIEENVKEIDFIITEPLDVYFYKEINGYNTNPTLDDMESPQYQFLPYQKYRDTERSIGYLWSSRGCSLSCMYCPYNQYYGRKIMTRSVEKLAQDIGALVELKINYFQFRDPFFTHSRQRTKDICNMIHERNYNIEWMCETRIDSLDKELICDMRDAGCTSIAFGIENADFRILSKHGRPVYDIAKIKAVIQVCKEYGIATLAFYMIGFPEDNWNTVEETYKLAEKLDTDYAQFNIFTYYPDNEENTIGQENITPDVFVEGKNMTIYQTCKNIPKDQLEELTQYFTFSYSVRKDGLKAALESRQYSELIKERGKKNAERVRKQMAQFLM